MLLSVTKGWQEEQYLIYIISALETPEISGWQIIVELKTIVLYIIKPIIEVLCSLLSWKISCAWRILILEKVK